MNYAIILAGGFGSRMGASGKPKQFLELGGTPILVHSLRAFNRHPAIDGIVLVCLQEWQDEARGLLETFGLHKVCRLVDAGETRSHSSQNGLSALKGIGAPQDLVLIHDAARPLVSQRIIEENIEQAHRFGACSTAIPCHDTILRSHDGATIAEIPPRNELYQAQTPQTFKYGPLAEAYARYFSLDPRPPVSDDCGVWMRFEDTIAIAHGEAANLKITVPGDIALAKFFLELTKH